MIKSFKQHITNERAQLNIKKRHRKEKRFVTLGLSAIIVSLCFLAILLLTIAYKARGAFIVHEVKLQVMLDADIIDPQNSRDLEIISQANYGKIIRRALKEELPQVSSRRERLRLYNFLSDDMQINLQNKVIQNPELIGQKIEIWGKVSSHIDQYLKGNIQFSESDNGVITSFEDNAISFFSNNGKIRKKFNSAYFTHGDSTYPERAGIYTAIIGSFFTMLVFLVVSFPFAVLTAIYLEEFAPKNKITDFIEININNLAAVPSVIYGLLGLSLFINFLEVPRSSALIGGLTLSMLVLPTIIISTRNSIKSVPPSLKEAALAVGASPLQVVIHHIIPIAMPGIMTGTILAVARAIGETAPLFMIGMIAFIIDPPKTFLDPTTVIPVQIYLWSDKPEIGFVEKTSATILFLILFLILINSVALFIREKFSQN